MSPDKCFQIKIKVLTTVKILDRNILCVSLITGLFISFLEALQFWAKETFKGNVISFLGVFFDENRRVN